MRCKAVLVGQNDILAFCNKAMSVPVEVVLTTGDRKYCVNGKSILGCCMAASEWGDDIWIEVDGEYYFEFEPWIEVAANDAANIHE